MTRDESPDPVTEATEAIDRLLAETALPALDLEPLPVLDLEPLPPLDLSDLTDLTEVTDLVDLDRLLAETAVPLSDLSVAVLVSEVLGRDGV